MLAYEVLPCSPKRMLDRQQNVYILYIIYTVLYQASYVSLFILFYLTFILPFKMLENQFSFTNMTWPRYPWNKYINT